MQNTGSIEVCVWWEENSESCCIILWERKRNISCQIDNRIRINKGRYFEDSEKKKILKELLHNILFVMVAFLITSPTFIFSLSLQVFKQRLEMFMLCKGLIPVYGKLRMVSISTSLLPQGGPINNYIKIQTFPKFL